jgi:hypothetical protein
LTPLQASPAWAFFLGWQTELEEVRFELGEIPCWITAKAPAKSPLLTAGLPFLPQLLPGTDVLGSEFCCGVGMQPGGDGGNHTDGATQDQGRGSGFAPCGTPFMIAIRPEKLFQIIIGPRQIRHRRAGEESWPVTASDLTEVLQCRCECPSGGLVSRHRAQQAPEATLHSQRLALVLVAENVGGPLDPAIAHTHVGPSISRVHHAPLQQGLQPAQFLGQRPLFAPRSRLAVIALRRSWSLSPEASRGGRPSSVRALRTAAQ